MHHPTNSQNSNSHQGFPTINTNQWMPEPADLDTSAMVSMPHPPIDPLGGKGKKNKGWVIRSTRYLQSKYATLVVWRRKRCAGHELADLMTQPINNIGNNDNETPGNIFKKQEEDAPRERTERELVPIFNFQLKFTG